MFLLNAVAFAVGLSASLSLPKPLSTISSELCKQNAKQTMSSLSVTPLPSRGPRGPLDKLKVFFRMKSAPHHMVSQTQTLPCLPPTGTSSSTTSVLEAPVQPVLPVPPMLCPPCPGSRPPTASSGEPLIVLCSGAPAPGPATHHLCVTGHLSLLMVTLATHDTAFLAESTDEG